MVHDHFVYNYYDYLHSYILATNLYTLLQQEVCLQYWIVNDTIRCPPSQSGSLQPRVTHELPTRRMTGRLGTGGEAGGTGVCVREYTAMVSLYKAAECHMCGPCRKQYKYKYTIALNFLNFTNSDFCHCTRTTHAVCYEHGIHLSNTCCRLLKLSVQQSLL